MIPRTLISRPSIAIGLCIFALLGCKASKPAETSHYATYEVTGENTDAASLTYSNETEGTEQRGVALPWVKRFNVKPGQFLYVSAQNQGSYGVITVRINIDGKPVKTATSAGEYAIASSSYRCCE